MTDILLHVLGAAVMMAPVFFATTLPVAWAWFAAVSFLWFIREVDQDRKKYGRWRSLSEWGTQKWLEALGPVAVALLGAIGVTVWRVFG